METTTIEMVKLVASDGYRLYDGEQLADKIYCKAADTSKWSEVTEAEAEEIQAAIDAAAAEEAEAAEAETETEAEASSEENGE